MASLKQRLAAVAENPTGALGWVGAAVMVVQGPSDCYHAAVADLAALQADDALLDVACGSGLFLRRHAPHVRRVAGIDQSGLQVMLARRILHHRIAAGSADVRQGDASALPWADGTFTIVTCNCLSCVVAAERAVVEMYRVLRPGGRVVLASDFQADPQAARRYEHEWGFRAWAEPELKTVLEQVGYLEVTLTHDSGATFTTARRCR